MKQLIFITANLLIASFVHSSALADLTKACHLVNEVETDVSLNRESTDASRPHDDCVESCVVTESLCRELCIAKSLSEDREICYWGEKKLFAEFSQEHKLCTKVEGVAFLPQDDLPSYPITKESCLRKTELFRKRDFGLKKNQGNQVIAWGGEQWGTKSSERTCTFLLGQPGVQEEYQLNKESCLVKFNETVKKNKETFGRSIWDNKFLTAVQAQGAPLAPTPINKKNHICYLEQVDQFIIYQEQVAQGRPQDCLRSCEEKIHHLRENGQISGIQRKEVKFPLSCYWDQRVLQSKMNLCDELSFYPRGVSSSHFVIINQEKLSMSPPIVYSKEEGNLWHFAPSKPCLARDLSTDSYQITYDGKARGSVPGEIIKLYLSQVTQGEASESGAVFSSMTPQIAKALSPIIPLPLKNKNIILTSLVGDFKDPLKLKFDRLAKGESARLQKSLVERGFISSQKKIVSSKGEFRRVKFVPQGNWLKHIKTYGGLNEFQLAIYRYNEKEIGILSEDFPDSTPDDYLHTFFVFQAGASQKITEFLGSWEIVDSGDFNGDGASEIVIQSSKGYVRIFNEKGEAQFDF